MQDAYSADRGAPQPPIPNTTSPRTQNIYLRQQRLLLILRPSTTEPPVRARGGERVAGSYGWSRAWQCLRLLKITTVCRLLALSFHIRWKSDTTCKKHSVRPSPRLLPPAAPEQEPVPFGAFDPRDMSQLQHGLTGWARLGCSRAGTELCIAPSVQLRWGARGACTRRGRGGEAGLELRERHAARSLPCCCRHTRGFSCSAPGCMTLTSPLSGRRFLRLAVMTHALVQSCTVC